MRKLSLIITILTFCSWHSYSQDLKLWYEHPAREWVESLPIGNGRLLATNEGGVYHEVIQLNDDQI